MGDGGIWQRGFSSTKRHGAAPEGRRILAGKGNLNDSRETILETDCDFKTWKTLHRSPEHPFPDQPAFSRDRGRCPISARGCMGSFEADNSGQPGSIPPGKN
jgi:photosystem II stability/assembly factor-like uncharacterized protein